MEVQDTQTGQVHLVGFRKGQPRHREHFTMIFGAALIDVLLSDDKMTSLEWRVLVHIWSISEYGNSVTFFIMDVAKAVAGNRVDVGRALVQLQRRHFIRLWENQRGRPRTYMLSPEFTFRGSAKQRKALRHEWVRLGAAQEAAQAKA